MKTAGYDPNKKYEDRGNTRLNDELALLNATVFAAGPQPCISEKTGKIDYQWQPGINRAVLRKHRKQLQAARA